MRKAAVAKCNNVITIPQYTGTCWFNAILMAFFYSQGSNAMFKKVKHLWKSNDMSLQERRVFNIFTHMISNYTHKKEDKAVKYEYFDMVTPEHVLETLHNIDKNAFSFHPGIYTGFYSESYVSIMFRLLKVKALLLDELPASTPGGELQYRVSKHTNVSYSDTGEKWVYHMKFLTPAQVNELTTQESYDCVVIFRNKTTLKYPSYYTEVAVKASKGKSDLTPSMLTVNGEKYRIDSCMLTNFKSNECGINHKISGVTCGNKRFIYNGWMKSTRDAARQSNTLESPDMSINRKAYPCELMPFDWLTDNDDFCVSSKVCHADKEAAKSSKGLCFNFGKSDTQIYMYVNEKFYKRGKASELVPANRKVPFSLGAKHVDKARWTQKELLCTRQVSNWSWIRPEHKFDGKSFSKERLLQDMQSSSPKMVKLLAKIKELDEADMKAHGKQFKHFIFSDLKALGYGAKIITSCLVASGFKLVYNSKLKLLQPDELRKTRGNNIALLSSTAVYGAPITVKLKKQLLEMFNSRPDNVYGDMARIIILDSGFKEGIDLFDIKYVHMFEPQLSLADQKQVIGRGTRTCGQRGLPFNPQSGWPLHVFMYDTELPAVIQDRKYPLETLHELYVSKSGTDVRLASFAADLEKEIIKSAVDFKLNKPIHEFKIKEHGGGAAARVTKKKDLWQQVQQQATTKHAKSKWPAVELENGCAPKPTSKSDNKQQQQQQQQQQQHQFLDLTPSQRFIKDYFTPKSPQKGVLVYHSVGTGKSCTAIATASATFERQGYTILWVTRTTLKSDIWKNMFEQICSSTLKEKLEVNKNVVLPKALSGRKRLLSKAWSFQPLSYKQFSNLLEGKNELYKKLVKINGSADPLRKTLLIIDEAHKLFNAEDLSAIEKPKTSVLYDKIRSSYKVSGEDSVKLMLMTATPITSNPMDFVKLVNMFKTESEAITDNFDQFKDLYLTERGMFTKPGSTTFRNYLAGHVSYLNREKDARQFAQPRLHLVRAPMSSRRHEVDTIKEMKARHDFKMRSARQQVTDLTQKLADLMTNSKANYKAHKTEVQSKIKSVKIKITATKKELKGKKLTEGRRVELHQLQEALEKEQAELQATLARLMTTATVTAEETIALENLKAKTKLAEAVLKKLKGERLADLENIKNDLSQERAMKEICSV